MWLNIKWHDKDGGQVGEIGAYGALSVSDPLDPGGDPITVNTLLDLHEENGRVYEAHYGMTQEWASQLIEHQYSPDLVLGYDRETGLPDHTLGYLADQEPGETEETFHFVLNNVVVKDNRIPPYGMSYDEAERRNALPVPADQYGGSSGGTYKYWDEIDLAAIAPAGAESATIDLLYQPTSWEYIQFLVLANKGPDPVAGGNAFLGDEGRNLFDAWMATGMAEPHVMASATWGAPPAGCSVAEPILASATPGSKEVELAWHVPAQMPEGFNAYDYALYYDQAGKAQHIADVAWPVASYLDTQLTNAQQYCYKLSIKATAVDGCVTESGFSNILCAVPSEPGQLPVMGLSGALEAGAWVRVGKGKNATTEFQPATSFIAGDAVVIRGVVVNSDESPAPVSGAVAEITIGGAGIDPVTFTSGPTNSAGGFEVTWQTERPSKKGVGGTPPGDYAVTLRDLSLTGYQWNEVPATVTVTIQ